jgi:hypothetical protein
MTKPEWELQAYRCLMAYVKRVSRPFTIDHARRCIGSKLETPPDDRWWGAVTKEAIREDKMQNGTPEQQAQAAGE